MVNFEKIKYNVCTSSITFNCKYVVTSILGAKDVSEYWELLSGYSDGYDKIGYKWNRIIDLHKKILKFAITTLTKKYNINMNDTIPAYLLGKYNYTLK